MALAEEPRWYWVAYTAALGAVMATAALIGGKPGLAAFCFVLLVVFGAVMRRWNPGSRLRSTAKDEREAHISNHAGAFTLVVMVTVLLTGALWEMAHGYSGPMSALCALFGASFGIGEFLARRRF